MDEMIAKLALKKAESDMRRFGWENLHPSYRLNNCASDALSDRLAAYMNGIHEVLQRFEYKDRIK